MTLKLEASSLYTRGFAYNSIYVDLEGINRQCVLDNFTVKDIFSCVDIPELLNEIGVEFIKEHFNLTEKP